MNPETKKHCQSKHATAKIDIRHYILELTSCIIYDFLCNHVNFKQCNFQLVLSRYRLDIKLTRYMHVHNITINKSILNN